MFVVKKRKKKSAGRNMSQFGSYRLVTPVLVSLGLGLDFNSNLMFLDLDSETQ